MLYAKFQGYQTSVPEVIKLFSFSIQLSMKFFILLINVKMPIIFGILTFISTFEAIPNLKSFRIKIILKRILLKDETKNIINELGSLDS